jgi:DNA replication protein DnaC
MLTEEVSFKAEKNVTMRTHLARFPFVKTLEAFDWSYQPALDKKQVQSLATCRFIETGENVILWLPSDRSPRRQSLFPTDQRRYERGPVILTSNQSFTNWGDVFGDRVIATAILDRLLHHGITVTIRGDSYRLKEKIKAGLLKGAEATS